MGIAIGVGPVAHLFTGRQAPRSLFPHALAGGHEQQLHNDAVELKLLNNLPYERHLVPAHHAS